MKCTVCGTTLHICLIRTLTVDTSPIKMIPNVSFFQSGPQKWTSLGHPDTHSSFFRNPKINWSLVSLGPLTHTVTRPTADWAILFQQTQEETAEVVSRLGQGSAGHSRGQQALTGHCRLSCLLLFFFPWSFEIVTFIIHSSSTQILLLYI